MAKKGSSSFIKQAAILASAGIIVRVIGFLYRLPLTNMIGDTGNAIYSAGYYIYTFLLILSSAGLPAAISKMVSERIAMKEYRNAHRVFKVSLFVSGIIGFLFMVILYVFAKPISEIVDSPESYWCIVSLSPTLFIVAIMSVYRGYFQGMNTMVQTSISQIVEQIFNAVFSVYLAYVFLKIGVPEGEKNIVLGAAGGTAGTGIGALAGLIIMILAYFVIRPKLKTQMRREGRKHKPDTKSEIISTLARTAIPIIAGTAIFSITNLADMVMVLGRLDVAGFTHDEAQILYGQLSGKYVTLTTLPVSITTAMATATIPSIAASVKLNEKENAKRKMGLTFRIAMILSIPAAVGIGVLGDPIIRMLFPNASEGGNLLTVGAISIIFLAICQIITGILQGIGRVDVPVKGAILGAITKIILNYFLISIPSINVLGAVISTTGCYAVASIYNIISFTNITRVRLNYRDGIVKPLFGSIIMGIACFGIYRLLISISFGNTVSTIISIVISMCVYGAIMLLIKGIREEDLKYIPMGNRILRVLKKFNMI